MEAAYLRYTPLLHSDGVEAHESIATLVLNRPESANAFNGELLLRLTELLQEIATRQEVRLLLLQGAGKHFSAGADLHWMQEAALLDYAGNIAESQKLSSMFEALAGLSIPTVALVKGAAFGGAVGLVAACDFAFALDHAKFCLSEAKIGLLPAVILPYLARKIPSGQLHRHVLSARVFTAVEAETMGLVQGILPTVSSEARLRDELTSLLTASPEAQAAYKGLHRQLSLKHWQQSGETVQAIATARASAMGQQGLQAFFQKAQAPWVRRLPEGELIVN